MGVTAVAGVATLTHPPGGGGGGDHLEGSGWLQIVMLWAGLMAPPMSAWLCTVVLFWSGEKMYICLVYTWWMSFETIPLTGSLVSVAANLRLDEFDTLFQDIVDCFARAISGTQSSLENVTGSGRLPAGRSGVDFTVQLDVPWNAPEGFVNMNAGPVLGLRARLLGAAVIRVMTGRDSWSVRVLFPDGCHPRRYESCRWTRGHGGRIGYTTIDVAGASGPRHMQLTV